MPRPPSRDSHQPGWPSPEQALAATHADPASTWIDAFTAIDQCLSQLTIAADGAPVPASPDSNQPEEPSCLELLEQAERVLASVQPGTGTVVAGADSGLPDRGDPGNLRAGAVSLTTFGDLLTEAEAVLTGLASRRTLDAAGMVDGWQLFARRAVHAITAATGDRDPRWYAVDRLAIQVARPMPVGLRGKTAAAVESEPALVARAESLVAAAGDLLAAAPRDSAAVSDDATVLAAQARVAGLLAAGAHLVARAIDHAEQAGPADPLVQAMVGEARLSAARGGAALRPCLPGFADEG